MAAAKQALRVVSYNVQRWSNVDALIHMLTRLRPDILCLQECCQKRGPEALQKVADACGLESVHFFGHTLDGLYGNAILTKSTSTFVQEMFLGGGSVIRGHHVQRGALLVEVGSLRVCCTHLDHRRTSDVFRRAGWCGSSTICMVTPRPWCSRATSIA
jgi:endonuclease/exonuclease/phosphatase family metal-dependent hydrolase